jgi:deoxyribonuclease-4
MFGLHIKQINGEYKESIKYYYEKYNCTAFQFFLVSPKRCIVNISDKKLVVLTELKKYTMENKILMAVHLPYTINIATTLGYDLWWIDSVIKEFDVCNYTNIKYLVLHTGKSAAAKSNEEALLNMKKSINIICTYIHKNYNKINTQILLENCAGQGTEMLYNINDFLDFYKSLDKSEKTIIKICIDTCHLFASGYDLKEKKDVDDLFNLIHKKVNIKTLKLIHLNDSKNICGSRVDRHEALGHGKINKSCIKRLIKLGKKLNIPMILESPAENPAREIKLIKDV